jgi:hypothetical protein
VVRYCGAPPYFLSCNYIYYNQVDSLLNHKGLSTSRIRFVALWCGEARKKARSQPLTPTPGNGPPPVECITTKRQAAMWHMVGEAEKDLVTALYVIDAEQAERVRARGCEPQRCNNLRAMMGGWRSWSTGARWRPTTMAGVASAVP